MTATATGVVPADVMATLDGNARELHILADNLASVERQLHGQGAADHGVHGEYQAFIDAFEVGLWERHVEGAKLPAKDLRLQLAHRDMPVELYGRYFALVKSRDRILSRISNLKAEIGAQRSILSALKEGLV